jgi:hypothetical protein
MGSDTGFLSLVTAPDVKAIADLKDRPLSVDALTTGYAFVLFDILRRNGLNGDDYTVAKVGGMVQRFNALHEHKQDGTMLSTPYNILAKAEGFTQLATATKVIGHYQGNVAADRLALRVRHPRRGGGHPVQERAADFPGPRRAQLRRAARPARRFLSPRPHRHGGPENRARTAQALRQADEATRRPDKILRPVVPRGGHGAAVARRSRGPCQSSRAL